MSVCLPSVCVCLSTVCLCLSVYRLSTVCLCLSIYRLSVSVCIPSVCPSVCLRVHHQKPLALKGHERAITQIRYNRDGDLLFSVAKDARPTVWWSENGERVGTYEGHSGALWCIDVNRIHGNTRMQTSTHYDVDILKCKYRCHVCSELVYPTCVCVCVRVRARAYVCVGGAYMDACGCGCGCVWVWVWVRVSACVGGSGVDRYGGVHLHI